MAATLFFFFPIIVLNSPEPLINDEHPIKTKFLVHSFSHADTQNPRIFPHLIIYLLH